MAKEAKRAPVVTKTEARQGERKGVIWVLAGSLVLAVVAGLIFVVYY